MAKKKSTTGNNLTHVGEILPPVKPLTATDLRIIKAADHLDRQDVLYQHTVFCQAGLPYRDPGQKVTEWQRSNGNVSLLVTAKKALNPEGDWVRAGIPFGPKARLILSDINTQAIQQQSPHIDMQGSLTRYVKRMNLASSGRNIRTVKEAMARVCGAQFQIGLIHGGAVQQFDAQVMSEFNVWFEKDDRQRVLWPCFASLSLDYYKILMEHGVPLDEAHYVALSHNSMAMDIYAWLAQRLHRIKAGSVLISWHQLHMQFGWHYHRLVDFRRAFKVALREVLTVYRVARVEADTRGLVLRNSPPPVLKTQILLP